MCGAKRLGRQMRGRAVRQVLLLTVLGLAATPADAASFTATFDDAWVVGTVAFYSLPPPGGGFAVDVDLQHPADIQVSYDHRWHIHARSP